MSSRYTESFSSNLALNLITDSCQLWGLGEVEETLPKGWRGARIEVMLYCLRETVQVADAVGEDWGSGECAVEGDCQGPAKDEAEEAEGTAVEHATC